LPNSDQARSWPYPRPDDADPRIGIPEGERQYHIALGPGELAEYVLLPGDPDRIDLIAERLTDIEMRQRHREFASVTGHFRGRRISAVSTGIGTDNVEITIAEILAITSHPTFIRIGSSGVLQDGIELGELGVTTGAVRLESTTSFFVHDGYPAVADYAAVAALLEAAHRLGYPVHMGITATAPGFYGAQGRPIPQLPIRYPDLAAEMRDQRVINFEMEASALLVLAGLAGCRAGVVCTAFAQRTTGRFVQGEQMDRAEAACIDTGLEALCLLAEMDEAVIAAGARHWRPSLWAPMAS
jgi:uridine phosphorylase